MVYELPVSAMLVSETWSVSGLASEPASVPRVFELLASELGFAMLVF